MAREQENSAEIFKTLRQISKYKQAFHSLLALKTEQNLVITKLSPVITGFRGSFSRMILFLATSWTPKPSCFYISEIIESFV